MRVLITGASGQLGSYLLREALTRDLQVVAWSHRQSGDRGGYHLRQIDLTDHEAVSQAFRIIRPNVVIHTAAVARLDEARAYPDHARAVNAIASGFLAELAFECNARLVHVSSDLVFDGEKGDYREEDHPRPLSVYGETKLAGERFVLTIPRTIVARLSLLFGPSITGTPNFFDQQLTALREGSPIPLFRDEWRSPLSFATAARALFAIGQSEFTGLVHVGGPERMTRLEMGLRLAQALRLNAKTFRAVDRTSVPSPEPRPRDVSLHSGNWRRLFPQVPRPNFEDALLELGLPVRPAPIGPPGQRGR